MPGALLIRDDAFLRHDAGIGHPENAARLADTLSDLAAHPVPGVVVSPASRNVTRAELTAVHSPELVELVQSTAGRRARFDADTVAGPDSYEVACLAAGAALRAAEAVCAGEASGAFALVRPPGHHAEAARAMGFCLFNNIAVAAEHAVRELGCRRVLVLDPDIHHGNGTQHSFEARDDVLYVSSHRYPFYPGTGWFDETGTGRGAGFTLNLPLPMGLRDADLLHVWRRAVEPVVNSWQPDLILVSAGFDTWHADPIGDLQITADGFAALFQLFRTWADQNCSERIACVLEGGYDPAGVAAGVRAALTALAAPRADEAAIARVSEQPVSDEARKIAERSRATMQRWWPALRS
jgi:acetoin utilization deacetylase AcuC-like enzyme